VLDADLVSRLEPSVPVQTPVWPQHWVAVQVFSACLWQWRLAPSGKLLGLDYTVIYPLLDRMRVKPRAQVAAMQQLAVLESELLGWFNRK
jgi:hypothetical protein